MDRGDALVRGRNRLSAQELESLLPAVERLRQLGASVIQLGAQGELTLTFDTPFALATAEKSELTPAKPEDDGELLFASAD